MEIQRIKGLAFLPKVIKSPRKNQYFNYGLSEPEGSSLPTAAPSSVATDRLSSRSASDPPPLLVHEGWKRGGQGALARVSRAASSWPGGAAKHLRGRVLRSEWL